MVRLKLLFFLLIHSQSQDFNPTMVRLKLTQQAECSPEELQDFNPTMVRLKLITSKYLSCKVFLFQSHNGSIKTQIYFPVNLLPFLISIPQWFD